MSFAVSYQTYMKYIRTWATALSLMPSQSCWLGENTWSSLPFWEESQRKKLARYCGHLKASLSPLASWQYVPYGFSTHIDFRLFFLMNAAARNAGSLYLLSGWEPVMVVGAGLGGQRGSAAPTTRVPSPCFGSSPVVGLRLQNLVLLSERTFIHIRVGQHDKIPKPDQSQGAFHHCRLVSGRFGNWASWSMEKNMLVTIVEATSASSLQPWLWSAGLLWCFWWVSLWIENCCSSLSGKHDFSKVLYVQGCCMIGLSPTRDSRATLEKLREASPLAHTGSTVPCLKMFPHRDAPSTLFLSVIEAGYVIWSFSGTFFLIIFVFIPWKSRVWTQL